VTRGSAGTQRIAFVTSAGYSGQLGGLAGADAICVAAATAAGLDRASSFLAWLSDGFNGPIDRFTDGAADAGYPYARRDGKLLAGDFNQMITLGVQRPLDIDELGGQLAPKSLVWTATGADGKPYNGDSCGMWTFDSFKLSARVGEASPSLAPGAFAVWKNGDHWTDYSTYPCKSINAHLYCFGQCLTG
jgi:hypothetical protein